MTNNSSGSSPFENFVAQTITRSLEKELAQRLPESLSQALSLLLESLGGPGLKTRVGRDEQSLNITIVNNTQHAISTNEKSGQDGNRELEIIIDQMVANSLVRGRQTTGILNAVFGLGPRLIGR